VRLKTAIGGTRLMDMLRRNVAKFIEYFMAKHAGLLSIIMVTGSSLTLTVLFCFHQRVIDALKYFTPSEGGETVGDDRGAAISMSDGT
jgi:hypothetical protein